MASSFEQQVAGVPLGRHLSFLYDTPDEQMEVVTPFFKIGLAQNHCCLYIAEDFQSSEEITARLLSSGLAASERQDPTPLRVLTKYETFLRYARFEPVVMYSLIDTLIERLRSEGFTGVRIMAEMTWALGLGCEKLVPYEARLNDHFHGWPLTMICEYNMRRFGPNILQDALRTHPHVIVRRNLCKNILHEPPSLVLDEAPAEARLEWMIRTVEKASPLLTNGERRGQ
jgi:chemotaxis family two-component system sensor kinase Cph1